MKRKIDNKIFEAHFNRVLNRIAASVKSVIDECDDNVDECGISEDDKDWMDECDGDDCYESYHFDGEHLDEMARTPKNRTIDPVLYKRVQGTLATRRKANLPLSTLQPNKAWSDEEIFNRYVSALLINGDPCPMNEEDVDTIETFAPYAHKFLDNGTYTIDDVITLYNAQDKHDISKKRGMKRGSVVLATEPTEDHDFDDDSKNANVPVQNVDVEDNEETVETPAQNNDPLDSDFEQEEYDNTPSYDSSDNEDEDEDEVETEDTEDDAEDDADFADEEINDLDDITYEVANDARMNMAIHNFNDRDFVIEGKRIGHTNIIIDMKSKDETGECTLWGETFADLMRKYYITEQARIQSGVKFKIKKNQIFKQFWSQYNNLPENTDDELEHIDDMISDYTEKFEDVETLDDFIAIYDEISATTI